MHFSYSVAMLCGLFKMYSNNNVKKKYGNVCPQKCISIWDSSCMLGISPHTYMLWVKPIMQESQSQYPFVSSSMSVCLSVCLSVCHSFSDLAPVCLSVCFNTVCHCRLCACLSVWQSIYSIRQSIPFVFDSWCVILYECLSDVIQVRCARAESPSATISFFFPPALSSVIGHLPVWVFWGCVHVCMLKNMQYQHEYRYAPVHISWHGVRMQTFNAAL